MERTREAAEDELQKLIPTVSASLGNDAALAILDGDLVRDLFAIAWTHRFSDDRHDPQRLIRQLVTDAIDRKILEDPSS